MLQKIGSIVTRSDLPQGPELPSAPAKPSSTNGLTLSASQTVTPAGQLAPLGPVNLEGSVARASIVSAQILSLRGDPANFFSKALAMRQNIDADLQMDWKSQLACLGELATETVALMNNETITIAQGREVMEQILLSCPQMRVGGTGGVSAEERRVLDLVVPHAPWANKVIGLRDHQGCKLEELDGVLTQCNDIATNIAGSRRTDESKLRVLRSLVREMNMLVNEPDMSKQDEAIRRSKVGREFMGGVGSAVRSLRLDAAKLAGVESDMQKNQGVAQWARRVKAVRDAAKIVPS